MSDPPSGRSTQRDPEGARPAREPVSVVVLAGGRASRLDGRKAERPVGGRRLLDRVLAVARAVSDDVVLCAGARALAASGARRVADWPGVGGPLGGLGAGLEAARHAWCLLLPCDLPEASAEVAHALMRRRADASRAVVVRDASGWQPFHGLYARALVTELRAAVHAGERSLVRWVAGLDGVAAVEASELVVHDPALRFLDDIDTPADLARAERRLSGGASSLQTPRQGSPR